MREVARKVWLKRKEGGEEGEGKQRRGRRRGRKGGGRRGEGRRGKRNDSSTQGGISSFSNLLVLHGNISHKSILSILHT